MPKPFESLTINLVDLDNVINLIAEKKPAGGSVTIYAGDDGIVVRDKDGMLIGTLQQVNEEGE